MICRSPIATSACRLWFDGISWDRSICIGLSNDVAFFPLQIFSSRRRWSVEKNVTVNRHHVSSVAIQWVMSWIFGSILYCFLQIEKPSIWWRESRARTGVFGVVVFVFFFFFFWLVFFRPGCFSNWKITNRHSFDVDIRYSLRPCSNEQIRIFKQLFFSTAFTTDEASLSNYRSVETHAHQMYRLVEDSESLVSSRFSFVQSFDLEIEESWSTDEIRFKISSKLELCMDACVCVCVWGREAQEEREAWKKKS